MLLYCILNRDISPQGILYPHLHNLLAVNGIKHKIITMENFITCKIIQKHFLPDHKSAFLRSLKNKFVN